jgi:protein SPT2
VFKSSSDDQSFLEEANFDQIEHEEYVSAMIGKKEDDEQLRILQQEEEDRKRRKRMR